MNKKEYFMSVDQANEVMDYMSNEYFRNKIICLLRDFTANKDYQFPDSRYLTANLRKEFQKLFDPEYMRGNISNNLYFEQLLKERLALSLKALYAADLLFVSKEDIEDSDDSTLGIQYEGDRIVQLNSVNFYVI